MEGALTKTIAQRWQKSRHWTQKTKQGNAAQPPKSRLAGGAAVRGFRGTNCVFDTSSMDVLSTTHDEHVWDMLILSCVKICGKNLRWMNRRRKLRKGMQCSPTTEKAFYGRGNGAGIAWNTFWTCCQQPVTKIFAIIM